MVYSPHPLIWITAIVLLILFWPLAQWLRHDKLHPLAAYLLFASIFSLVGSAAFTSIVQLGQSFLPEGAMGAPIAAVVALLFAVVPGFAAARWIVRKPQMRRMPH